MRKFLLFMILTLTFVGCGKNKKGSENEISFSPNEIESVIESTDVVDSESEETLTLTFGYATDNEDGFCEIIEIN